MGRSGGAIGLKPSPLLKIFLLNSSTFHIMTNTRSQLRCGPKYSPLPTLWSSILFSFHHLLSLLSRVNLPVLSFSNPILSCFPPPLSTPVSLPLLLSGLPECSGADHELCPWHVIPLASGAACAVHLRPHGIFTQHQWPHRLCHSGGEVGEIRAEEGVCTV